MRWLGYPIAILLGFILRLRHFLYDRNLLHAHRAGLPTIAIGNLSLGGSGKTPMTEYLIRILSKRYRVGVLSRGYGRKTKGFRWVEMQDSSASAGDEPIQIKRKFPEIHVAVCEDRLAGLEKMQRESRIDLVILDDALQHRPLIPDIRLLLTTAQRPFWKDALFPVGRLRDLTTRAYTAHAWIITKCNPEDEDRLRSEALSQQSNPFIPVFSSSITYGEVEAPLNKTNNPIRRVVGVAGLADSSAFRAFLEEQYELVEFVDFRDHHEFSQREIERLWKRQHNFADAIMTTEKDWMRIASLPLPEDIPIGFVRIETRIHQSDAFHEWLMNEISNIPTHE